MYLVFTRMLGESFCRRRTSLLLCLCDVFRVLLYLTFLFIASFRGVYCLSSYLRFICTG